MALFGSDDDLEEVAALLDTRPNADAIGTKLQKLDDRVERIASALEIDTPADATSMETLSRLDTAVADGTVRRADESAASHGGGTSGSEVGGDTGVGSESGGGDTGLGTDSESRRSSGTSSAGGAGDDRSPASVAATRVSDRLDAPSRPTRRLLETLQDGSVSEIEDALATAADKTDRASMIDSLETDRRKLRQRLDEAQQTATDRLDGTAADTLTDRIDTLRGRLDRADDQNPAVPSAIDSELTLYRETLFDLLAADSDPSHSGPTDAGGAPSGPPSDDPQPGGENSTADVAAIRDRRREITERYVNQRDDHSHTIPLLFLSSVDTLAERAEEAAAAGRDANADGICTATEELLDAIEALYKRNQYSVMLRQLRG